MILPARADNDQIPGYRSAHAGEPGSRGTVCQSPRLVREQGIRAHFQVPRVRIRGGSPNDRAARHEPWSDSRFDATTQRLVLTISLSGREREISHVGSRGNRGIPFGRFPGHAWREEDTSIRPHRNGTREFGKGGRMPAAAEFAGRVERCSGTSWPEPTDLTRHAQDAGMMCATSRAVVGALYLVLFVCSAA